MTIPKINLLEHLEPRDIRVIASLKADAAIKMMREKRSPAVLSNKTFEDWLRTQG